MGVGPKGRATPGSGVGPKGRATPPQLGGGWVLRGGLHHPDWVGVGPKVRATPSQLGGGWS